jgi:lipoate-protein ligase A
MAKPTKYDVMVGGKKVGGAAQRKTRHGFLHQGSISLRPLCEEQGKRLFIGEQVFENMRKHSFTLLGETATEQEFLSMRAELKELLKEVFYDE